jgi:hypothetical protein
MTLHDLMWVFHVYVGTSGVLSWLDCIYRKHCVFLTAKDMCKTSNKENFNNVYKREKEIFILKVMLIILISY